MFTTNTEHLIQSYIRMIHVSMNLENKNIYSTNLDDFSPKNKWVLETSFGVFVSFANALSKFAYPTLHY